MWSSGTNGTNQPSTPALNSQLSDRAPGSEVDVYLHRSYASRDENRTPSLPVGPTSSAPQISYCSPLDTINGVQGSYTTQAASHRWSYELSYRELPGDVSSPLTPVASHTEPLVSVQPTTTYGFQNQQASNGFLQPLSLHKIESGASFSTIFSNFHHPTTADTGTPAHITLNDPRNSSIFPTPSNTLDHSSCPAFPAYFDPSLPQAYHQPNPSQPAFHLSSSGSPFSLVSNQNPVTAMLGHRPENPGYVNLVRASDAPATIPASSSDVSDVEETVVVDAKPEATVDALGLPLRKTSLDTSFHSNPVVDQSSPKEASSTDKVRSQGSPPRDFVNLSIRDGQLFDEKKGEGVTDIITHSFEQPSQKKKQRGPLTKEQREAAGKARKLGACFRCHAQRIRVSRSLWPPSCSRTKTLTK